MLSVGAVCWRRNGRMYVCRRPVGGLEILLAILNYYILYPRYILFWVWNTCKNHTKILPGTSVKYKHSFYKTANNTHRVCVLDEQKQKIFMHIYVYHQTGGGRMFARINIFLFHVSYICVWCMCVCMYSKWWSHVCVFWNRFFVVVLSLAFSL